MKLHLEVGVLILFWSCLIEAATRNDRVMAFRPITQEQYEAILGITAGEPVISEARLIASGVAAVKGLVAGLKLGFSTGWLPSIFGTLIGTQQNTTKDVIKINDGYPLCVIQQPVGGKYEIERQRDDSEYVDENDPEYDNEDDHHHHHEHGDHHHRGPIIKCIVVVQDESTTKPPDTPHHHHHHHSNPVHQPFSAHTPYSTYEPPSALQEYPAQQPSTSYDNLYTQSSAHQAQPYPYSFPYYNPYYPPYEYPQQPESYRYEQQSHYPYQPYGGDKNYESYSEPKPYPGSSNSHHHKKLKAKSQHQRTKNRKPHPDPGNYYDYTVPSTLKRSKTKRDERSKYSDEGNKETYSRISNYPEGAYQPAAYPQFNYQSQYPKVSYTTPYNSQSPVYVRAASGRGYNFY